MAPVTIVAPVESSFVKKGDNSIGVAKQYCGSLGKVENCQVNVFAGYVSELGYTLADKRLFLPEQWFDDSYAERRHKCKLPEDITFKTKPKLAAEMLASLRSESVLPFKYILADSVYGMSPDFISAAEALPDATYLVQVSKSTQVWLKQPMTVTRDYRWGKKAPSITLSQLKMILDVLLPLKKHDVESILDVILGVQVRNHRAYLSHRKRRDRELGQCSQVTW